MGNTRDNLFAQLVHQSPIGCLTLCNIVICPIKASLNEFLSPGHFHTANTVQCPMGTSEWCTARVLSTID